MTPILVIDFNMSTLLDDKPFIAAIKNLERERDFKKILSADSVDSFFKIAKILVNQLGWIIEFDCFRNMSYRLKIPMIHPLDAPLQEEEGDVGDEEVKDDSAIRMPHNETREIQSANRDTRDYSI